MFPFESRSTFFAVYPESYSIIYLLNQFLSCLFSNGATAPSGPRLPHYRGFTITHFRHTTLGRTPLDVWSARRRDLYLTTHNTHNRQASMPPAGFEPTISASEQPQTHALNRAATEIGQILSALVKFSSRQFFHFLISYVLLFVQMVCHPFRHPISSSLSSRFESQHLVVITKYDGLLATSIYNFMTHITLCYCSCNEKKP
jgi:hypothetical protein